MITEELEKVWKVESGEWRVERFGDEEVTARRICGESVVSRGARRVQQAVNRRKR